MCFEKFQTNGVDLPTLHEVSGDPGDNLNRLAAFLRSRGIQLVYNASIASALGKSYGGRIAILAGQTEAEEFSTLVHEAAHEMLHKAERRSAITKTIRELEAEAIAFVAGKAWDSSTKLPPPMTSTCIRTTPLYWPRAWKSFSRPPAFSSLRWSRPSQMRQRTR